MVTTAAPSLHAAIDRNIEALRHSIQEPIATSSRCWHAEGMSESGNVSPSEVTEADERLLLRAIDVARRARHNGNHPFGALLVASDGRVLESENTVVTDSDPTGHAETNLVRLAARTLSSEERHASTLYTSTEPCAMCSGAIYWAGIGRVVYALPEQDLAAMVPSQDGEPTMDLPCRDVFAAGGNTVHVAGPALLEQAAAVHADFWDQR
jgi:tRNA(Arg) A34 adenosine deaminase TadA